MSTDAHSIIFKNCNFERRDPVYISGFKALEFAKSIPDTESPPFNIHLYWRVPLPFERKQAAAVKSLVVTQKNAAIHLWSNVDLSDNEWVKPLLPFIRLCRYDPNFESKDTPLENFPLLRFDDDLCYPGGDLFRLLILYKYGGVYVDIDVLTLRDFSPLMCVEFMYQWGTEINAINGAIMHIRQESKLADDCLKEIRNIQPGAKTTNWGSSLYRQVRNYNKDWIVFPCAFFNPEWQLYIDMGNEEDGHPFCCGDNSHIDFPGSFSWHWFNKWDAPIHPESKFARLEKTINEKFEALRSDK